MLVCIYIQILLNRNINLGIYLVHTYMFLYRDICRDIYTDPKHFGLSLLGGFAGMPRDLRSYNYKSDESKKKAHPNSCIYLLHIHYHKKTFTYCWLWRYAKKEIEET